MVNVWKDPSLRFANFFKIQIVAPEGWQDMRVKRFDGAGHENMEHGPHSSSFLC